MSKGRGLGGLGRGEKLENLATPMGLVCNLGV